MRVKQEDKTLGWYYQNIITKFIDTKYKLRVESNPETTLHAAISLSQLMVNKSENAISLLDNSIFNYLVGGWVDKLQNYMNDLYIKDSSIFSFSMMIEKIVKISGIPAVLKNFLHALINNGVVYNYLSHSSARDMLNCYLRYNKTNVDGLSKLVFSWLIDDFTLLPKPVSISLCALINDNVHASGALPDDTSKMNQRLFDDIDGAAIFCILSRASFAALKPGSDWSVFDSGSGSLKTYINLFYACFKSIDGNTKIAPLILSFYQFLRRGHEYLHQLNHLSLDLIDDDQYRNQDQKTRQLYNIISEANIYSKMYETVLSNVGTIRRILHVKSNILASDMVFSILTLMSTIYVSDDLFKAIIMLVENQVPGEYLASLQEPGFSSASQVGHYIMCYKLLAMILSANNIEVPELLKQKLAFVSFENVYLNEGIAAVRKGAKNNCSAVGFPYLPFVDWEVKKMEYIGLLKAYTESLSGNEKTGRKDDKIVLANQVMRFLEELSMHIKDYKNSNEIIQFAKMYQKTIQLVKTKKSKLLKLLTLGKAKFRPGSELGRIMVGLRHLLFPALNGQQLLKYAERELVETLEVASGIQQSSPSMQATSTASSRNRIFKVNSIMLRQVMSENYISDEGKSIWLYTMQEILEGIIGLPQGVVNFDLSYEQLPDLLAIESSLYEVLSAGQPSDDQGGKELTDYERLQNKDTILNQAISRLAEQQLKHLDGIGLCELATALARYPQRDAFWESILLEPGVFNAINAHLATSDIDMPKNLFMNFVKALQPIANKLGITKTIGIEHALKRISQASGNYMCFHDLNDSAGVLSQIN